jgi:hypothetical protein
MDGRMMHETRAGLGFVGRVRATGFDRFALISPPFLFCEICVGKRSTQVVRRPAGEKEKLLYFAPTPG